MHHGYDSRKTIIPSAICRTLTSQMSVSLCTMWQKNTIRNLHHKRDVVCTADEKKKYTWQTWLTALATKDSTSFSSVHQAQPKTYTLPFNAWQHQSLYFYRARDRPGTLWHMKKKKHVDKGANTLQIRRARHIAHSVQAGFPAQQYGSQLLEAVGEKRRAYSPLRVQGYLSQSVTTH